MLGKAERPIGASRLRPAGPMIWRRTDADRHARRQSDSLHGNPPTPHIPPASLARPRGILASPIWKSPAAAAAVTGVLIVATFGLRFGWFARQIPPIGFGVPVVIITLFRRRKLLWLATAIFVCGTILKATTFGPVDGETPAQETRDCCLIDFDLLLVAFVCDRWIVANGKTEKRTAELELANHELIGREEEIARQNEELQSTTEELERQHEELTVSNDELARREGTLEVFLALSRSLTVQGSQQEMMQRICDSLSVLLEAPRRPRRSARPGRNCWCAAMRDSGRRESGRASSVGKVVRITHSRPRANGLSGKPGRSARLVRAATGSGRADGECPRLATAHRRGLHRHDRNLFAPANGLEQSASQHDGIARQPGVDFTRGGASV